MQKEQTYIFKNYLDKNNEKIRGEEDKRKNNIFSTK